MTKALVIVESPTKARTIEKFLGNDFDVTASYGHVRDLPSSADEIPENIKKEKWTRIGIKVDENFEPLYIIPDEKKAKVKELKALLKNASELYLATDEDREGESISWHLLEVLQPKIPVKRLVFHEITREAIQESLNNARNVDENMVKAQETRRIIDRLYGYSVSPLLWKKMPPARSAGRVQSVALRLLVERERERIAFRKAIYWDLKANFNKLVPVTHGSDEFEAELVELGGKKVAIGKDFDPNTGKLLQNSHAVVIDEAQAQKLQEDLLKLSGKVLSIEEKPYTARPYPPFTTSTLQQEASSKLSYGAKRTMQVAQRLYENGLITYMRTDSTTLSAEALKAARKWIEQEYGKEYLHSEDRIYKTKVRNAQEAHEAIRPAGAQFAHPSEVKERMGEEAFRLYELIWKRTVASQMKDAVGTRVSVNVGIGDATFRANGRILSFPGFLRAYVEGSDNPDEDLAERDKVLPPLKTGEELGCKKLEALKHETQPPARYSEGSLIKELERLGIGRPSTWATIVEVVLSRDYAFKRGSALVPSFVAQALIGLMELHFTNLVDYEFTAKLEDDLDVIALGQADNLSYLKKFYFGNGHPGLKTLVSTGEENIDPRLVCGMPLGQSAEGKQVEVVIGRYGAFVSDGEQKATLPDDLAPDELSLEKAVNLLADAKKGPEALGPDPKTNLPVYLKKGRFGPYLQLGDMVEGGEKPKMTSLLPGMSPNDMTLELALKLLELPRCLGKHPENNEDVMLYNGRYGPYIKAGTDSRNLAGSEFDALNLTLDQALEMFKRPKGRGGRTISAPKVLKALGKTPDGKSDISVRDGRYGAYVTDGETNATVPKGSDPAAITLEEALSLLEARKAAGGGKKKKKTTRKKKAS